MTAEVDAGFGVELGPLSLKALADIELGINSLSQLMRNIRKVEEAYEFGAREVALRGGATADSNGDAFYIGLGGPAYGRIWQVRRLTIGGALWTTSVEGSALVTVAPAATNDPPLTDVADEVASLPSNGFYSTGQLIIRHPNHLRVVILSPTASTSYSVGGAATDMPDKREPITTPN